MSWKKNVTITAVLTSSALAGIHILNKIITLAASKFNLLNDSNGKYYKWKFGNIYYEKTGYGKPILLVHDLNPYSSSIEWNKLIDKLSESYTVYAIDLLGCGRSDKPNLTYTNFFYVQMINDFIKNIIGARTNVIATGVSGSIILGACHNDDSFIDKIIMVNPTNIKELSKIPGKRSKTISRLLSFPIVGTLLYNILVSKKNTECLFCSQYFSHVSKIDPKLLDTYFESAHCKNNSSRYLYASLSGYYLTANIPRYLDGINNSIFIIVGDDKTQNLKTANTYQELLPSIEIINIENAKHLPQLECPEKILEQIPILFADD